MIWTSSIVRCRHPSSLSRRCTPTMEEIKRPPCHLQIQLFCWLLRGRRVVGAGASLRGGKGGSQAPTWRHWITKGCRRLDYVSRLWPGHSASVYWRIVRNYAPISGMSYLQHLGLDGGEGGGSYLWHKPAYHPPTYPLQIPHISLSAQYVTGRHGYL